MARPPQGRMPGDVSSPDDEMTGELPFHLPRADSDFLDGSPLDQTSNDMTQSGPAASDAGSSEEVVPSPSVETVNPSMTTKALESLAGIAGPDLARDPFAYYAMPRVQPDRSAPDRTIRNRMPDPVGSERGRFERVSSDLMPPTFSASRQPDDVTHHADVPLSRPMMPQSRFTESRDRTPPHDRSFERDTRDERLPRSNFERGRDMPRLDPALRSDRMRERLRPDTTFGDEREFFPPQIRDASQRPMRRPVGFDRFGPMDDGFKENMPLRNQHENIRFPVEDEAPVPVDIRVTRTPVGSPSPRADDRRERRRDGYQDIGLSGRSEPRFDSASDEAVSFVDQDIPPLRVTEFEEQELAAHGDLQNDPAFTVDRNQHDGMDALTSRLRDHALDMTERLNTPRGDAVLDQAKNAIAFFRGKVDEVRVARAEARYKAAEAGVEQPSDDDIYDPYFETPHVEASQYESESEAPQRSGPLGSFLKAGLADRFVFNKRAPVRAAPSAQRIVRHRRQSRLYEDIVAWIVVPPFIVGAIYGVLELAKYIASSPIGKMLSGQ